MKAGRRTTYARFIYSIGRCSDAAADPASLSSVMAAGGYGTKASAYSAFTEQRAPAASHDTALERRELVRWLSGLGPRQVLVDIERYRHEWMLKALLGVRVAAIPYASIVGADPVELVGELWREMMSNDLGIPLVAATSDHGLIDALLEGSTRYGFDLFLRLDPFYWPKLDPRVPVESSLPLTGDRPLGIADLLQVGGSARPGEKAKLGWLTLGQAANLAWGPSQLGHYYIQRYRQDWKLTARVLRSRVAAFDAVELDPAEWPVHRMRVAPSATHSRTRIHHAWVMACARPLFDNPRGPEESSWARGYEAWDRLARQIDGRADEA